MRKATVEIRALLRDIDVIIEVLDARIPYSSQNPVIAQFSHDKPQIKLLNKSDLADPVQTEQWIAHFNQVKNTQAMAVHAKDVERIRQLTKLCHKLVTNPPAARPLQALITGIPNVGKSTLINILANRTIAKTGDEPAVTKAQQRIKIADDLALIDTPGILWPKFDNQNNAYRLAATGAIKDTAISHDDIAFYTVNFLCKHYPEALKARYQLTHLPETELEFLETIGRSRGCLVGGGLVDLNKIGKILITDLRSGRLGNITLETPAMATEEIAQTALLIKQKEAEKAAKKAARLQKHKKNK